MSAHNLCFEQKYEKYQNFYLKTFSFGGEIFNIFESKRHVFIMLRYLVHKVKSVKEQMRQSEAIRTINFFKVEGIMGHNKIQSTLISSKASTSRYPYLDISELQS